MVQVIQGNPRQSAGEMIGGAIGQGLGGGFQSGMNLGISSRLNQMLQEKETAIKRQEQMRQGTALAKALGKPDLGEMFGNLGPDLSQLVVKEFGVDNLSNAMMQMAGIGGGQGQVPNPAQSMQQPQQMPQEQTFRGAPYQMPGQDQQPQGMSSNQENVQPSEKKQASDQEMQDLIKKAAPKDRAALIKQYNEQKKMGLSQEKFDYEKEKDIKKEGLEDKKHIDSQFRPSINRMAEKAEEAEKNLPGIRLAITTNERGKTSPATWDAFVQSSDNPFLKNFKSENAQILEAQAPLFIASFKDKMGGVLTDAKINLIAQKTIGVGKDKNVNRLLAYMGYYDTRLDQLKDTFSKQIVRENDGYAPKDFDQKIKEKMHPYQKMIDKDITDLYNGKIPKSDISKEAAYSPPQAQSKVPAAPKIGTPLDLSRDEKLIDMILDEANGDPKRAEEIAQEKGYTW